MRYGLKINIYIDKHGNKLLKTQRPYPLRSRCVFFALIALLDSIHFMSTQGHLVGQVYSLLDVFIQPITQSEVTYSETVFNTFVSQHRPDGGSIKSFKHADSRSST